MNLGIDLGTSRTVVAAGDRGNYPVVRFRTPAGDWCDWYPSLIGWVGSAYRFGFSAASLPGRDQKAGLWRSFKRDLGRCAPDDRLSNLPDAPTPLELLTGYPLPCARHSSSSPILPPFPPMARSSCRYRLGPTATSGS